MGKKASSAVKYKKAPQAPRRFKSAYMFFSTEKHKSIRREKGENIATTQVAKLVSIAWKNLPPEERARWEELARRDKARFAVEKQMYNGPWKVPISKASRDPNAPKRPMSAFLSFSNSKRGMVKRIHPNRSNSELSKLLATMWREAPPAERKIHIDREFALRQKYKAEMAKWKKHTTEERDAIRLQREQDALRQLDSGRFTGNNNSSNSNDMEPLPAHMSSESRAMDAIPLAEPLLIDEMSASASGAGQHSPQPLSHAMVCPATPPQMVEQPWSPENSSAGSQQSSPSSGWSPEYGNGNATTNGYGNHSASWTGSASSSYDDSYHTAAGSVPADSYSMTGAFEKTNGGGGSMYETPPPHSSYRQVYYSYGQGYTRNSVDNMPVPYVETIDRPSPPCYSTSYPSETDYMVPGPAYPSEVDAGAPREEPYYHGGGTSGGSGGVGGGGGSSQYTGDSGYYATYYS